MATVNRSPETRPRVPAAVPGDRGSVLTALRRFHRRGPGPVDGDENGAGYVPALLHAYRDPSRVRDDYPLLLRFAPDGEGRLHRSLADALEDGIATIAPEPGQARVLRDNLRRIERVVRARMQDGEVRNARAEITEAGPVVARELALAADPTAALMADATRLADTLPADAILVGDHPRGALRLLLHLAQVRASERRAALHADVTHLAERLADLLRLDRGKETDARTAGPLGLGMGEAGAAFIDPAALSRTLGDWRGAAAMPRERRDRIDRVLLVLRRFLSEASAPISVVAAHDLLPELSGLDEGIEVLQHPDPLSAAALRFDEMSAGLAEVFAAMHVARMELLGQYDPDRHDPWLEGYGWRSFSREERRLLPAVIAVESADRMSGTALPALSRTILSGRPLHILVDVHPAASSAEEDPRSGSRLELGYLAIGHRDAFVHQSTPARPDHLLDGFDRALAASRPALHLLAVGSGAAGAPPVIGDWLQVGAAIEARAHPLFIYDPEAGATWARRLDFGGNPAVDQDWPATELSVVDASGETRTTEIAFTFADLALLEPDRRDAFRVVPEVTGLDDHDDLVPVDRYLAADPVDAVHQIPFVWGVDAGGELRRLAVAGSLVAACRDRLDFWRTLQELAGVRNAYVTEATERVRSEMAEALAAERARLAEARDNAVAEAEERAAGDAMEALSRMLLDLDLDGAPPVARAPSRAGAPRVASSTASPPSLAEDAATSSSDIATSSSDDGAPQAAASSAVEDDDGGFDDPWIDTPRCTSCNDCMTVNALTFVYDENKQARIGDASAATFEHLVRAAELCPAKCIHPGKPQNPDEPNLDELIRRAARFNA